MCFSVKWGSARRVAKSKMRVGAMPRAAVSASREPPCQ
jgi:hypothetical protein